MQRKKKALEAAQEDINVANSRITELTQQINDLLSSNNDYLVHTHLFYFILLNFNLKNNKIFFCLEENY